MISMGKPGNYPVALIPGQNTDYYKKYTSNELKYFPLNTVLYGPLKPNERHFTIPNGSDGSQSEIDDDSSSSEESSSSSSEETQDTEETNSTADEDDVGGTDTKSEKDDREEEKVAAKASKGTLKTPRGRGRGRLPNSAASTPAVGNNQPEQPKKRLGRPPKLKLAAIKLKRLGHEEISEYIKDEKPDTASRVIIHTCKMCHEEESKNKNGEFEAFIQCAQCKGKIHPSCIDLTAEMIPKISSYRWQCTDCKSCVKCEQSSNEDKMIFCDQCDRGYHIYCVGLSEVPSGNYICHVCKPADFEEDSFKVEKEPEEGRVDKKEKEEEEDEEEERERYRQHSQEATEKTSEEEKKMESRKEEEEEEGKGEVSAAEKVEETEVEPVSDQLEIFEDAEIKKEVPEVKAEEIEAEDKKRVFEVDEPMEVDKIEEANECYLDS